MIFHCSSDSLHTFIHSISVIKKRQQMTSLSLFGKKGNQQLTLLKSDLLQFIILVRMDLFKSGKILLAQGFINKDVRRVRQIQ